MTVALIVLVLMCLVVSAIKWLSFRSLILSKEVMAALIGALVLIVGYAWTAQNQQNLQLNEEKASAYNNFLSEMELGVQTQAELASEATTTYDDQIRKQNAAFAVLETIAPDCVIQNIYHEVFNNGSGTTLIGTEQITMMELILHNDLYRENEQECTSTPVTTSSFMLFYLR